jgi:hypothetical protein
VASGPRGGRGRRDRARDRPGRRHPRDLDPADQYAGRHLGFVNAAIYRIGRGAGYHQAFHDITTGNSTVTFPQGTITGYRASPGWDPVTGWGSPDAQVLIPLLARYTSP